MARIGVTHHLDDLTENLKGIVVKARKDMPGVVRQAIKVGNQVAKDNARRTEGTHGKYYHRAFSYEMSKAFHGFGASVYSGEYGPDISKPQGGMSFEGGSRNQPPHKDLAKSADLIGPTFAHEVGRMADGWFW